MKTELDLPTANVGDIAPYASWINADGANVCLTDYRGAPVVLAFLSTQWDPGRELQLELFNQIFSGSARNIEFVRISRNVGIIEATVEHEGLFEIPVFEGLDSDSQIARAFGVFGKDALILVDEEGYIAYKYQAESGMLPPADELMAALASIPKRNVSRRQFVFTAVATLAAVMLLPKAEAVVLDRPKIVAKSGPAKTYTLNINGRNHQIPADSRITVLNALRDYLGMTGTKKGCDHGQCGACTVHLNGRRVNSCLILAAQAEGASIRTIEGLARGEELHPVQQAFIEHDGFQCGYCTPGQIMSAVACIQEGHTGSPEEIREWMSGNICRCGAYQGILESIQNAKARMGHA
jgi:xanthine dehydrogenase YagT iron-sulfur-binding subunit